MNDRAILQVTDLSVSFGSFQAVRDVSFDVGPGETVAIVGESGSGKTVTAMSVMRLVELGTRGRIDGGTMYYRDRAGEVVDLCKLGDRRLRQLRGGEIAMIFQEPLTALNPVYTVGHQVAEVVRLHQGVSWRDAKRTALEALERVRIPEAKRRMKQYPHELSGGMRQRVMIAQALAGNPRLLIADEPTTALDVTIQAQILSLIATLQDEMDAGVLFITHDMGVVAEIADRVVVMKSSEMVESGDVHTVFASPQHPYTRALLGAVPRLGSMADVDGPQKYELIAP